MAVAVIAVVVVLVVVVLLVVVVVISSAVVVVVVVGASDVVVVVSGVVVIVSSIVVVVVESSEVVVFVVGSGVFAFSGVVVNKAVGGPSVFDGVISVVTTVLSSVIPINVLAVSGSAVVSTVFVVVSAPVGGRATPAVLISTDSVYGVSVVAKLHFLKIITLTNLSISRNESF